MSHWINTKVVLDCDGNVLEKTGYWHEGPVAECKGGGSKVKETPEEKELASISAEKFERFRDTFVPLENEFIRDVRDEGTKRALDEIEGRAAVGAQQASPDVPSGLDPSSGAFDAAVSEVADTTGKARARAVSDAGGAQRNRELRGLQAALSIGKGQEAEAMQGLSETAGRAVEEASRDAISDFRSDTATRNLIGTGLGLGASIGASKIKSGFSGPSSGTTTSSRSATARGTTINKRRGY